MATATEIEKLVVRLVGDGTEYQKMLQDARKHTEQAGQEVEGFAKNIEGFAIAAGAALATLGIKQWLQEALGEFQTMESTALKLTAVLEANGREVQELTKDYEEFAAAMQQASTTGDDAVKDMLTAAETFDLTGESAKKAVKDAMALSKVTGAGAESLLGFVAAIAKGDMESAMMYKRMIRQLRGVKDEAALLEKTNKLLASGMKAMAAEVESSAGQIDQLKNDYGDLMEEIGAVVAQGLTPLVTALKSAVKWLQDMPTWLKQATVGLAITSAAVVALVAGLVAFLALKPLIIAAVVSLKSMSLAFIASPITLWVVAIVAAAVAIAELKKQTYEARVEVQKFNESQKLGEQLTKRLGDRSIRETKGIIGQSEGMGGDEKRAFLSDEIEKAKKQVKEYDYWVKLAKANLDDMNHTVNEVFDPAIIKQATAEVNDQVAAQKRLIEKVNALKVELSKTETTEAQDQKRREERMSKTMEMYKAMSESLRVRTKTMGMTPEDAEMFKFKEQVGFDDPQRQTMIDSLEMQQKRLMIMEMNKAATEKAQVKERELTEAVDGLELSLGRQIDTFGMSTEQMALYDMVAKGATEAQLAFAKEQSATIQAMKANQDMMEKGKQITKEFQTPQDAYMEQMLELGKLLQAGAIDQGTYGRAVDAAKDKLEGVAEAQKEVKMATDAVNGSLSGSADAYAKLADYRDTVLGMNKAPMGTLSNPALGIDNRGGVGPKDMRPLNQPGGASIPGKDSSLDILKEIRDLLKGKNQTVIEVSAAGFNGGG